MADAPYSLMKEDPASVRLETATVRRWFQFDREALDSAARAAGFRTIHTEFFEGCTFDGSVLPRIIARR